ncbi:hypothetical protein M413DRAFT_444743 [Hebeloma cylindrosporum]|uniref:Sister chromatid cohesion protein n=1 Tax=Hebeloma cylindrosporum TaxID=76867 RepID=A0A0C2XXD7_HEBCY|nr:hypothetical protein M413DRAFT_444743 [Hebeloma cylindrosporum h7]
MAPGTRKGGQNSKTRLKFNEKLAGKGLTTDALLTRLKTLHTQLAALDQETVDTSSLNTTHSELINRSLLLHKDRGVKAYTACCLADILRLYAPEAPYNENDLRDIFQFFFRQLSAGFNGPDEPYYNEYFHLIESLSTVKSVILVCDLPSSDELIHEIFKDLFTIVKRNFTKKVEIFMADILVELIMESNSLPSDALEVIMSQFVDSNARLEQPGFRLAVQVCNAAADKLQRHVCQYFGDILLEDDDLDNIRSSHDLIKRIHRSCPAILHSVIPMLEAEIRADALQPRLIATQTLGEMYADKGGPDLVKKYPSTWNAWVNRKADIAVAVRLKCVEATPALITNLPEARETLEELLKAKIHDPDEKVRAAACKVYSQIDYEAALHHVSVDQLHAVTERGMDKKRSVRTEALNSVGRLYNLAYPELESNVKAAIQQFSWIPNEVLVMALAAPETRSLVEQILFDYILPLPSISTSSATKDKEVDESAWTDRLLYTTQYLGQKSMDILISLSGLKNIRPNIYDVYLETCIKNNGGIIDSDEDATVRKLKVVIQHIAASFADPVKASEDLHSFAKLNENRLYRLMKTCNDPQSDIKSVIKATNEFTKRTEELSSNILSTMTTLLRRGSYIIVNQSSIPVLFKRVVDGEGSTNVRALQRAEAAQSLLRVMAKHAPALFKAHVGELCKLTADENKGVVVELAVMALANIVRWDEKIGGNIDKKTNERIFRLALDSDWRQAKFAARYLAFCKNKVDLCAELVESIASKMKNKQAPLPPVCYISALAQIARFSPDAFEQKSDVIMGFLIKRILMLPSPPDPEDPNQEIEWVEDANISDDLRRKLLSLKVCRNRCLAHATSEQALEIATPVLRLLTRLVECDGTLNPETEEDSKVKARMRLEAAVSLLHLSEIGTLFTAIAPKFVKLACMVMDTSGDVRAAFLTKLITFQQSRKLPPQFNLIPFLTLLDPDVENKAMGAAYIEHAKKRMPPALRLEHLELIFTRFLHLLAHHPDFALTEAELLDMASYVKFYLDLIASSENISLLYHLSQKGKTVRDPESHTQSVNFYIMCEIAQILIKAHAQSHSWLLSSYPGKVRLPSDILRPMPNTEATNQNLKTVFLPDGANDWLTERFKLGGAKGKEKKEKASVPAKRKAPTTKTNGHAKRTRRNRGDDDDNDDDDDDDGGDEEEPKDSDVEMEDAQATPRSRKARPRKSDASEEAVPKQSRAQRLSARTQAKEKSSNGNKKGATPPSDEDE